jgi:hypothetical protein
MAYAQNIFDILNQHLRKHLSNYHIYIFYIYILINKTLINDTLNKGARGSVVG